MDAFGDGPTAAIDDRLQGGLALSVAYRPAQLPADCSNVRGRAAAAADHALAMLEPGEVRDYELRFSIRATHRGEQIHGP